MKRQNILKVYKRDIKNTIKNPIAFIIILALCIIPALYAWINILACWDIYENTGSIPVAVVNSDETVLFNETDINIGEDVVEALKKNDKIEWTFVSKEEADNGLSTGQYYASIEIPSTFTDDFLSVLTQNPQKPHIIYTVDTKSNPVAVKITDSAKNTLVQQIKSNFVATVNETIFKSLNTIGDDADTKKEDLIRLKDFVVTTNRNIDLIDNALGNIRTGSSNYETFMTDMDALMPSIEQSILVLEKSQQNRETRLKNTKTVINQTSDAFDSLLSSVILSNDRIQVQLETLNSAQSQLSEETLNHTVLNITYQIQALDSSISASIDYLEQIQKIDFNTDIRNVIKKLQRVESALSNLKENIEKLQKTISSASESVESVRDSLQTQIEAVKTSEELLLTAIQSSGAELEALAEALDNSNLKKAAKQLKSVWDSSNFDALSKALSTLESVPETLQTQIDSVNDQVSETMDILDEMDTELNNVIQFLKGTVKANTNRQSRIDDINESLQDIQDNLEHVQDQVEDIQTHLSRGNEIADSILEDLRNTVSDVSTKLLNVQKTFLSTGKEDVNTIIDQSISATQNTSVMIASLKELNTYLADSAKQEAQGGQMTSEFAAELQNLLHDVKDTLKTTGERLELMDNSDITLLISLLQSNPEFMGDFMANPFDLKTEIINAIPNYGSSMAPIYSTLALWVGCLFLNSVLKAYPGEFEGSETISVREKHFGKMFYFWTLALLQGLIISIGDIALLKIHTVNAPLFIFFSVLAALVFSTITFTLMATLSNFGKALAIVYMILQLAGSGGTYPIQVDPLIFRILQPFFPFTYTVNGFREAVAGPLVVNVFLNVTALIIFWVVFMVFGYLAVERLHPKVQRFERKLKASGLGE